MARGPRPRPKRHFDLTRLRLREIERIIESRGVAFDTDDADLYLLPVAQCFLKIRQKKFGQVSPEALCEALEFWASERKRALPGELLRSVVGQAFAFPAPARADPLAVRLRLRDQERLALGLRTIGACDADRTERARRAKERKRLRERERSAAKRRAAGAVPRGRWLAGSLARTQPWLGEGVSKETWYRRRRARAGGTGPLPEVGTGPLPHDGTSVSPYNSSTGEQIPVPAPRLRPRAGLETRASPKHLTGPKGRASGGTPARERASTGCRSERAASQRTLSFRPAGPAAAEMGRFAGRGARPPPQARAFGRRRSHR